MAELADFLDLTAGQARQQFRELRRRFPVSSGRQVTFLPVETLLCLAASFLVNHRRFGGSTAHQAPDRSPPWPGCSHGLHLACSPKWPIWTAPLARRQVGHPGRGHAPGGQRPVH